MGLTRDESASTDQRAPIVALRSADPGLLEAVRAASELVSAPVVICPPGSSPPQADLLLDSYDETQPEDTRWVPGPAAAWVALSGVRAPEDTPGAGEDAVVLVLPDDAEELLYRMRAAVTRRMAQVVGVLGARGGAGASALAAVIARASAAEHARTALLDLDDQGAGLDLLLGLEKDPGLRWADLAGDRGHFAAAQLTEALPIWRGVRVLSADWRGGAGGGTTRQVVETLAADLDVVVLDVTRRQDWAQWAGLCDVLILLAPCDVLSAAGVQAARRMLGRVDLRLVVRGPAPGGLTAAELADACEVPLLWHMRPERSLAAAIERGVAPGDQSGGPLMRAGRGVVSALGLAG